MARLDQDARPQHLAPENKPATPAPRCGSTLSPKTTCVVIFDFYYLHLSPPRSRFVCVCVKCEPDEGPSNSRVCSKNAIWCKQQQEDSQILACGISLLTTRASQGLFVRSDGLVCFILPLCPCFACVPLRFSPCGPCARLRSLRTGWSPDTEEVKVEAAISGEGGDFGSLSSLTEINVRGSAAASSLGCLLILSPRFRPMWPFFLCLP